MWDFFVSGLEVGKLGFFRKRDLVRSRNSFFRLNSTFQHLEIHTSLSETHQNQLPIQ